MQRTTGSGGGPSNEYSLADAALVGRPVKCVFPFELTSIEVRLAGRSTTSALHLPAGLLRVPDSNGGGAEVTVESTGRILGALETPTAGASVRAEGQIDNHGIIALTDVTPAVFDHHYRVSFDSAGGIPTDTGAGRSLRPVIRHGLAQLPARPVTTGPHLRGLVHRA